jgi:flavin-dependent dehydrogenase
MLLETAELAGIKVSRGVALTESAAGEDCWHLKLQHATQVMECDARFVIDASGRSARFSMRRGAKTICDDRLAGVFVLFEMGEEGIGLDTMIEAAEDGWWYSITVPGGIGVAAWMSDTDLIREKNLKDLDRWSALLAQSPYTKRRMKGTMMKRAPMIFSANSQRLDVVCGRGWVAAGDAAMAFDPLSSLGITKALRSGKMASFVAVDFLHGLDTQGRYATLAAAEYAEYQRTKTSYYSEEKRWPHSPFWARRISL